MRLLSRTLLAAAGAVVALQAALVGPVAAQAWRQERKQGAVPAPFPYRPPAPAPRAQRPHGTPPLTVVAEVEPNDSTSRATAATLGDTVSGVIDPSGDVDYYAVSIPANTTVDLDVDARAAGSPLDPVMALIAPDGQTVLAYSDDFDGLDSRIQYFVADAGRYFVGIAAFGGTGGPGYTYVIRLGVLAPGPGDPTTLFASGVGYPAGMAASAAGDLYLLDRNAARIVRVSAAGTVSLFAPVGGYPFDMVVDGVGDLLVGATDSMGLGVVLRFSPGGERSIFARSLASASAITVGPDGDVWVADGWLLRRFDPGGMPRDSVPSTGNVSDLAFSPAGELHYSTYGGVYKLVGGSPVQVISTGSYAEGLAFDADGYLYVADGYLGRVMLYSPTYQQVGDVFARSNLGGPISLAFGRTAAGAMTSRLFAANGGFNLQPPYAGGIVEMNPAGVRAAGFRVGVDLLRVTPVALRSGVMGADYADTLRVEAGSGTPQWRVSGGALPAGLVLDAVTGVIAGIPRDSGDFRFSARVDRGGRFGVRAYTISVEKPTVTVADAANHLLGAGVLTPALERFMDLQGNRNGRYDVGDLRALLRERQLLPTASLVRATERRESKP